MTDSDENLAHPTAEDRVTLSEVKLFAADIKSIAADVSVMLRAPNESGSGKDSAAEEQGI